MFVFLRRQAILTLILAPFVACCTILKFTVPVTTIPIQLYLFNDDGFTLLGEADPEKPGSDRNISVNLEAGVTYILRGAAVEPGPYEYNIVVTGR